MLFTTIPLAPTTENRPTGGWYHARSPDGGIQCLPWIAVVDRRPGVHPVLAPPCRRPAAGTSRRGRRMHPSVRPPPLGVAPLPPKFSFRGTLSVAQVPGTFEEAQ